KSCSCRFFVPVEIITRLPERIAGTRYASVFPVPVPASTIRCRRSVIACSTACAICSCPRRNSYAVCVRESKPPGPKKLWRNLLLAPSGQLPGPAEGGWEFEATEPQKKRHGRELQKK